MLDGRASSSSPAFLACMLQMPITFFPLVPTPQSAIHKLIIRESGWLDRQKNKNAHLINARVFAALIRRNEQDYRKKTEEVCKIFRALKEEYTQIIAISMKNINKALSKLDRRNSVSNNEKVRKKLPKELKRLERCFDNDEGTVILSH
jgi:hypothetical protein